VKESKKVECLIFCRVNRHVLSVTASLILTFVLSLVIFVHVASAQDVEELKTKVRSFGLSADVNSEKDITVKGETNSSSSYGLELNPDSGITINWQARITVNAPFALKVEGKGSGVNFKLMSDALIENKANNGIGLNIVNPVKLNLSGGVIKGHTALTPAKNLDPDTKNATILFFTGNSSIHNTIASDYPNLKGIVFGDMDGRVYGSVKLTQALTIPEGYTLTIPAGASLNNQGVITNNGKIVVHGTLSGKKIGGKGTIEKENGGGGGGGEGGAGGCNAGFGTLAIVVMLAAVLAGKKFSQKNN
jgi:hypothetical protein